MHRSPHLLIRKEGKEHGSQDSQGSSKLAAGGRFWCCGHGDRDKRSQPTTAKKHSIMANMGMTNMRTQWLRLHEPDRSWPSTWHRLRLCLRVPQVVSHDPDATRKAASMLGRKMNPSASGTRVRVPPPQKARRNTQTSRFMMHWHLLENALS